MYQRLLLTTAVSLAIAACGSSTSNDPKDDAAAVAPEVTPPTGTQPAVLPETLPPPTNAAPPTPGTPPVAGPLGSPRAARGAPQDRPLGAAPTTATGPQVPFGVMLRMLSTPTFTEEGNNQLPEILVLQSQPQKGQSEVAFAVQSVISTEGDAELAQAFGPAFYRQDSGGLSIGQNNEMSFNPGALPFLTLGLGPEIVPETATTFNLPERVYVNTEFADTARSAVHRFLTIMNKEGQNTADNTKRRLNIPITAIVPTDGYVVQWTEEQRPAGAVINSPLRSHNKDNTNLPPPPPPGTPNTNPPPNQTPVASPPTNQNPPVNQTPSTPSNPTTPTTPSASTGMVQLYIDYQEQRDPNVFGLCWYVYVAEMERQTCTLWNFGTDGEFSYVGQRITDWTGIDVQNGGVPAIYGPIPPDPSRGTNTPLGPKIRM